MRRLDVRTARAWLVGFGLAVAFVAGHRLAIGEDGGFEIVRIEEDWELVLGEPDVANVAPQVTTTLSPTGDLNGYYVAFELNHQSQPDFAPGGLQLQLWNGEEYVSSHKRPGAECLAHQGEIVRWTQTAAVEEGGLAFEITHGSSTTWGDFGGQGYLKAFIAGGVGNLNEYRSAVSVANSGVGFAGNRVVSLTLKRVRAFLADGRMVEDTAERPVHPRP
jgi:hypothetical protein